MRRNCVHRRRSWVVGPDGRQHCPKCGAIHADQMTKAEKFWRHVHKTEGCWEWTAALFAGKGYGQFRTGSPTPRKAHRVAWELTYGPIPAREGYHGTEVCHKCDNPKCVRPDHLFLGSHHDNMIDMHLKGRHPKTAHKYRKVSE